ncbi:hypothetical protein [Streptomyces doebereineriae]|uniref:Uncharacterized protein n=1 Tax=Streptomyces doebereineriae TaxID=3075528 RepID=A0ABU2V070_9ACTN|nr:hypothetical protein [Streptomyces sp. DSM 41640]MDT0478814.1 hypothetical protein [Streptomyces sp. DSM 41640]
MGEFWELRRGEWSLGGGFGRLGRRGGGRMWSSHDAAGGRSLPA